MPRTPEQSALLREKRKEKILQKALRLFSSLTFDELTIDDIASACNCSHGLFYHYYPSKEAVYNALMKDRSEKHPEWEFPTKEVLDLGGYEGLKMAIGYILDRLHDSENAVLYLHLDLIRANCTFRKSEPLLGEEIDKTILKLVKKAMDDGDITKGDPVEFSSLIIDAATGAASRRISLGSEHRFKVAELETILYLLKH